MWAFRARSAWWMVAVAVGGACTCGPDQQSDATLTIVSPRDGVRLNRADDIDPSREGIQVEALLSAEGLDGRSIEIQALTGRLLEPATAIVSDGLARAVISLDEDTTLVARARDAQGIEVKSEPVSVAIDPAQVACSFVSPADRDELGPDHDVSPEAGFQAEVRVRCVGVPLGEPVQLSVDGVDVASATLGTGSIATFPSVELAEGENELRSSLIVEGDIIVGARALVTVATGACRVVVSPQTGTVFNARGEGSRAVADLEPGAPMQAELGVTVSEACVGERIEVLADGEVLASANAAAEVTTIPVELPEGTIELRAVVAGGDISGVSPRVRYRVDSVVPTATISFPRNGDRFDDGDDVDRDTPGLQILVRGATTDIDGDGAFELLVDEGLPTETILSGTLQPNGEFSRLVTLTSGSHTIRVRASRESGTTAESPLVSFDSEFLDASLAFVSPGDGDLFPLGRDARPDLAGFQLPVTLAATNLAGATGEVRCGAASAPITVDAQGRATAVLTISGSACAGAELTCTARVGQTGGPSFDAAAVSVLVDAVPPEVQLIAPQPNAVLASNQVTVLATTSCPGEEQSARLLRGTELLGGPELVADNNVTLERVTLPAGESALVLRLSDRAGNATDVPFTVFVDADQPEVVFVTPAGPGPVTFGASDDEQGDLSNGLQRTFVVAVDNELAGTLVELRVGDRTAIPARTATENGRRLARFENVSLPEGESSLEVCAIDDAGTRGCATLSVRVDTGRPLCAIVQPQDGRAIGERDDRDSSQAGVQSEVRVTASTADGSLVSLTIVDPDEQRRTLSASVAGGEARFESVSFAAEGAYLLEAVCQNASGPAGAALPNSVRVDFTAPEVQVVSPAEGHVFSLASPDRGTAEGFQIDVRAIVSELTPNAQAKLVVQCGAEPSRTEPPVAVTSQGEAVFRAVTLVDDGECSLAVTVEDAAGNLSAEVLRRVRVDRIAPSIQVLQPSEGAVYGRLLDADKATDAFELAQVSAIVSGANAPASLSVGTQSMGAGNLSGDLTTWSLVPLSEGLNSLTITATDEVGNTTSITRQVTVDTNAPVVYLTAYQGRPTFNARADVDAASPGLQINVAVTGERLSAGTTIRICSAQAPAGESCLSGGRILGSVQGGSGGSAVVPNVTLPEGEVTFHAEAVDTLGNSASSAPVTVFVDTVSPRVESLGLFRYGAGETELDVSSGSVVLGSSLDSVAGGAFDARLRATISGVPANTSVRWISSHPVEGTLLGTSRVAEDGTTSLDVALADGGHRIHVQATDPAGNSSSMPGALIPGDPLRVLNFAVDTRPPSIVVVAPSSGKIFARDDLDPATAGVQVDVVIDSDAEAGQQVSVRVDSSLAGTVSMPVTGRRATARVTLPDGAHEITATVSDLAGNTAVSVPVAVQVDGIAPSVTITSPAPGLITDDLLADEGFQIDVTVAYGQVEVGQPIALSSSKAGVLQQSVTDASGTKLFRVTLPTGQQNLVVRVTDSFGNVTDSEPVTITISGDAPAVAFVSTENPMLFGASDGVVEANRCLVPVEVTSDTDGAIVELLVDGVVHGAPLSINQAAGGRATFAAVPVPTTGSVRLQVKATAAGVSGYSAPREASCDVIAPTLGFSFPAAGGQVRYVAYGRTGLGSGTLADKLAGPDLEADFTLMVEGAEGGELVLTSSLDGEIARQSVPSGGSSLVTFTNAVLRTTGKHTLTASVRDAAGNPASATLTLDVNVQPPGAATLVPAVTDRRRSVIELSFTAPADDGSTGRSVATYEVRYAAASQGGQAISDESRWTAARIISPRPFSVAAPGQLQTLVLEGLSFEETWFFAVRAVDGAGNLGPVGGGTAVNLSLSDEVLGVATRPEDNATSGRVRMLVADVDGDGHDDVLVGNTGYEGNAGIVQIVFGGETRERVTLRRGLVDAHNQVVPTLFGANFGVGDINGDGRPDLIVASANERADANGADTHEGALLVYFGNGTRFTDSRTADLRLLGPAGSYLQQFAVVPDLNDDGIDDLVVGLTEDNARRGKVLVVAGRSNWGSTGTFSLAEPANVLASITQDHGAIVQDGKASFGSAFASLGDIDGDGAADFAVSAPYGTLLQTSGAYARQKLWVISGRHARGTTTAEAIGTAVVAPQTGGGSQFGRSLAAGDWNGDGVLDLAVVDANFHRAYVYSGAALAARLPTLDGPSTVTGSATPFVEVRHPTALQTPPGPLTRFANVVFALPDLNGDGRPELAVGYIGQTGIAPLDAVHVVFGRAASGWNGVSSVGADVVFQPRRNGTNFGVLAGGGSITGRTTADVAILDLSGNLTLLSDP